MKGSACSGGAPDEARPCVPDSVAEQILSLAVQHMVLRLGALCVLCLSAPVLAASDHSSGDGSDANNERLQAGVFPAEPVLASGETLREPYDPIFDIDWSTSLRGTYTEGTGGERFDVRLVPTISFDHQGSRSAINITGSAEMVRPRDEKIDVSALRLDLSGGYQLDSVTALQANANLTLTQDIVGGGGECGDGA